MKFRYFVKNIFEEFETKEALHKQDDFHFTKDSEILQEASLGRLVQHMSKREPIAIVSANRQRRTSSTNKMNYEQLKQDAKKAGFGYNEVLGRYIEDKTGEPGYEPSIILYADPEREEELRNFVCGEGQKFGQETVLFIDTQGISTWLWTRGGRNPDKDYVLGAFHPKQIGEFYTKIGYKAFTYDV